MEKIAKFRAYAHNDRRGCVCVTIDQDAAYALSPRGVITDIFDIKGNRLSTLSQMPTSNVDKPPREYEIYQFGAKSFPELIAKLDEMHLIYPAGFGPVFNNAERSLIELQNKCNTLQARLDMITQLVCSPIELEHIGECKPSDDFDQLVDEMS